MSLIPNNAIGNATTSNSTVSTSDGVLISINGGFSTQYVGEWVEVGGLSNLTIQCQSTDYGLTPDSNVGSALITVEIANGVYPNFIIDNQLGAFRVDQFLVPLTSNQTGYPSSAITRNTRINSKFVRFKVDFPNPSTLAPAPAKHYIKLYVNMMISA